VSTVLELLQAVAADVADATSELNRLDAVAGDGDLGATMATAAAALQALLPELEGDPLASVCRRCGSELARKAPSTSGTLLATAFLRAGAAAAASAPQEDESHVCLLARLVVAGQQGIQDRGKAKPGDKTMLDALIPAAVALQEAAANGERDIRAAVAAAARAATAGAQATGDMRATVGRAGWLADRSAGHQDAGAYLVALIFDSAARHLAR
jgi:dihydroxyacetone kinase